MMHNMEDEEYEIICSESGYILRAFAAPAPSSDLYALAAEAEPSPMYYVSIGAFYMALCDGRQIRMTAYIAPAIRLYKRIGDRFKPITRSSMSKNRPDLNDLYITYDQCTTVMLHFFVQVAYMMDPSLDIESLMSRKHDDSCMMETIRWIQNLEAAIRLAVSRLSAHQTVADGDRMKHVFAKGYAAAAFPYVYLLFHEHLLHNTIRHSSHPLGKRRLLPMLVLIVEGYIVYGSGRTAMLSAHRSSSSQERLLGALNLSLKQRAEENAAKLLSEEAETEARARRKAEKKRAKRARCKQKKKEAEVEAPPSEAHNEGGMVDDGDESDKDSVEWLMDDFPDFTPMLKRIKRGSLLSPEADPFIPTASQHI